MSDDEIVTKPGVIYFPSLPPYMNAVKLKHILEQYGKVGRVYLTPEDATKYSNRVKSGGCKKDSFTEGWVEFLDKQAAKQIALALNSKPVGGKKRHNFYHDDIWCMRYLSKFTWNDLIEHRVYQKQMNRKKLQTIMSKQKKEDEYFLESVAKKKEMDSAEIRRGVQGKIDESKKKRSDRPLPKQKTAFIPKKARIEESGGSVIEALAM